MVEYIIKRDGRKAKWDSRKIEAAVLKCFHVAGTERAEDQAFLVAAAVEAKVKSRAGKDVELETVQYLVQETLMEGRFFQEAIEYITYSHERAKRRADIAVFKDNTQQIDSYLEKTSWRVAENANMGHSFQGLMLHLSGTAQSRYTLGSFPEKVREAHQKGFMHIHDLSFGLAGYCAGWSLRDLLLEGFNLKGYCSSGPAKHFDAALGQMVNFLGTLQNEWAGAQAFNNMDTYLAPFVCMDGLTYNKVRQAMQKFVFNLNTTSRWGGQTPFTNLTFDLSCPKHLRDEPAIIGGKYHEDLTLGDFQDEMDMINRAFLEVMLAGDYHGRIFSFPIPTYNVTEDFPWESEVGELLLKMTAKFGVPYFQNFINSDLNPEDVRSMCCRLQMNLKEIQKKTGGLFGAGDLTGSIGVVTLNLPRLAFLAEDELDFLARITEVAHLAKQSLELKRKMLNKYLPAGLYPWTRRYLKSGYNGHFSTIGLVGGHEACLNLLGKGIETREGTQLMRRVLLHLETLTVEFQKETGNLYNLEATPAEGTSYRLARLDRREFADIITSGNGEPYYTNSTALPVGMTDNLFEALEHQDQLQPLYTGGTVFHALLGEAVTDSKALKDLLVKAMSNTKMPYISVTPTFSICEDHGYIAGEHFECPTCGAECEVYTRIVGYYRPVSRWNKGKQAEYKERKAFTFEYSDTSKSTQVVEGLTL